MSKLYRARSLLYRRQILQVNIRWKALDEIYKIYMLLHRSDLKSSANMRPTFLLVYKLIFEKLIFYFSETNVIFNLKIDELLSEFRMCFQKMENNTCRSCCQHLRKCIEMSEIQSNKLFIVQTIF